MSLGIRKTRTRNDSTRNLTFDRLEARLCLSSYITLDLVPPDGHDYSVALGLNDYGLAVGRSLSHDTNDRTAIVWSVESSGDVSVARLPGIDGEPSENANEVNNQGMIAGGAWTPPANPGGDSFVHAAVWIGAFGSHIAHDLGTLGGEYEWSTATSISEPDAAGNLWVAGGSGNDVNDDPRSYRGLLWQIDAAGNVLSMTDLEPSSDNVSANDVKVIGNSVYVAGDYYNETVGAHACVWQVDLDGALLGAPTWEPPNSRRSGHSR